MPELTVVIPCYNETRRLEPFFSLIREHAELPWEWLFVDDGSTDDTAARIAAFAADQPRVRLIGHRPNRGKGAAVRLGLAEATGDHVGYVDVDLAASPLDFRRFLAEPDVRDGRAMVLGIRLKTHDGAVERLFYRHVMGRVFQTYTSMMTGLTVYDTQCGFKLLRRDHAHAIAARMQCDGFAFDVELILLAKQLGLRLREELIPWREMGNTKVRPRHILMMLLEIYRIRRHHGPANSR